MKSRHKRLPFVSLPVSQNPELGRVFRARGQPNFTFSITCTNHTSHYAHNRTRNFADFQTVMDLELCS